MAERSARQRRFKRVILYPLEAVGVYLIFGLMRCLPARVASAFGGWIGRMLGKVSASNNRVEHALARAFPEKDAAEIQRIRAGMWDNLGRVLGEFAHLKRLAMPVEANGAIEIVGAENLKLAQDAGAALLFSGHMANWELMPRLFVNLDAVDGLAYRAPNNPFIARIVRRTRGITGAQMVPKGAAGAKQAIALLRSNKRIAMLIDQKMNDGIPVPFFGHDAMTAPALGRMALKYDCPIIPVQLERLAGCRFRMTFHPPMTLPGTSNTQADTLEIMTRANRFIEDCIRQHPEQWLWIHRRWPDS